MSRIEILPGTFISLHSLNFTLYLLKGLFCLFLVEFYRNRIQVVLMTFLFVCFIFVSLHEFSELFNQNYIFIVYIYVVATNRVVFYSFSIFLESLSSELSAD